ncbi:MAG: metallophosphoesterase family protein [Candidatus Helarchaeota archaeon]
MTRILFASDFHGNGKRLQTFFRTKSADIFIIGGDIFSIEGDFRQVYVNQTKFANEVIKPLLKSLRKKEVYLLHGNNDVVFHLIEEWENEGLCHVLHEKIFPLGDFDLIGFGHVPPTPFPIKNHERRDLDEFFPVKQVLRPVLYKKDGFFQEIDFISYLKENESLINLLKKIPEPRSQEKAIYIMHSPPHDTDLDFTSRKEHVGSKAIRYFIEEKQPALFLCGHIHEAAGIMKMGRTSCANSGNNRFISFEIQKEISKLELF